MFKIQYPGYVFHTLDTRKNVMSHTQHTQPFIILKSLKITTLTTTATLLVPVV